jgi:hypothetical protein
MDGNPRDMIKKGDSLFKSGNYREAAIQYMGAAQFYAAQGFALKSVALWKQIRSIAASEHDSKLDADARANLVPLYRSLGLEADAQALEAETKTRH